MARYAANRQMIVKIADAFKEKHQSLKIVENIFRNQKSDTIELNFINFGWVLQIATWVTIGSGMILIGSAIWGLLSNWSIASIVTSIVFLMITVISAKLAGMAFDDVVAISNLTDNMLDQYEEHLTVLRDDYPLFTWSFDTYAKDVSLQARVVQLKRGETFSWNSVLQGMESDPIDMMNDENLERFDKLVTLQNTHPKKDREKYFPLLEVNEYGDFEGATVKWLPFDMKDEDYGLY